MDKNDETMVYQHEGYIETVIEEDEHTRLVFCSGNGVRPLYRLETDDSTLNNTAYPTLHTAMDHFDLATGKP